MLDFVGLESGGVKERAEGRAGVREGKMSDEVKFLHSWFISSARLELAFAASSRPCS